MNKFYKNIIRLTSSTALAKIIGLATIPLITRLYGPSDMGVLSTFTSIIMVLTAFTALRYNVAIPLPKSDRAATHLVLICLTLISLSTLFLFLILSVFYERIFSFFDINEIKNFWFLIPIAAFIVSLSDIIRDWYVRIGRFSSISLVQIKQSIVGTIVKVIPAIMISNPIALIIGQIINQGGMALFLLRSFYSELKRTKIKWQHIKFFAYHYKDIPIYRLPSQVLLAICANMPILFFSSVYGSEVTGQVGLALTALSLPISFIASSVSQVFYSEIAKLGSNKTREIFILSKAILLKLTIVSIIPFTILFLFSEKLFDFVFGEQWVYAGEYASILSFYIVGNLISSPFVNILNVYRKNISFLIINLTRFILISSVFIVSYYLKFYPTVTLLIYSLCMAIHYAVVSAFIFFFLSRRMKNTMIEQLL